MLPRRSIQLAQVGVLALTLLSSSPFDVVTATLVATANITGAWEVEATFDDTSLSAGGFDCVFKQDGEQLTGACAGGTAALIGEVKGQDVSWQMKAAITQEAVTLRGSVDEAGTSMRGRFTIGDKGGRFAGWKQ